MTRSSWNAGTCRAAGLGSTSLLRVQRSSRVVAAPPLLARQAHLLAERARRQLTRQLSREARRPHVHRPLPRQAPTAPPSPRPFIPQWHLSMVQLWPKQLLWQLHMPTLSRLLEAVPQSKVASKLRPRFCCCCCFLVVVAVADVVVGSVILLLQPGIGRVFSILLMT